MNESPLLKLSRFQSEIRVSAVNNSELLPRQECVNRERVLALEKSESVSGSLILACECLSVCEPVKNPSPPVLVHTWSVALLEEFYGLSIIPCVEIPPSPSPQSIECECSTRK